MLKDFPATPTRWRLKKLTVFVTDNLVKTSSLTILRTGDGKQNDMQQKTTTRSINGGADNHFNWSLVNYSRPIFLHAILIEWYTC